MFKDDNLFENPLWYLIKPYQGENNFFKGDKTLEILLGFDVLDRGWDTSIKSVIYIKCQFLNELEIPVMGNKSRLNGGEWILGFYLHYSYYVQDWTEMVQLKEDTKSYVHWKSNQQS